MKLFSIITQGHFMGTHVVEEYLPNACLVFDLAICNRISADVAQEIISDVRQGRAGYVCAANVHMVVTARVNNQLKKVLNDASIVIPDGLPLVWVSKLKGFKDARRVTGTDLALKICEAAEAAGISVSFYGGSKITIDSLRSFIIERFPLLKVASYESPPMLPERPKVNPELVDRIKSSGAQIVFVGLGCPKQEFWMAAYSPHLPAVLIGVGAAFDFIAGTIKRAPVWMQKSGLEWLYRLLQEPLRLWKRYVFTNTLFVLMVLKEMLKGTNHRSRRV
jgi:N-acetylglucosaminyldiphosphoundecaprenol N-acetyl-beta-D-mannosaminyltransferase